MADPAQHPGHDDDPADDADDGSIVDLEELVTLWSQESAIEDELAGLFGTPAEARDWISLAEAERVTGVSRSTLRAWYRSGRVPSRLMPGPHGLQRLVPRDDVITQAARSPRSSAGSGSAAGTPSRPPPANHARPAGDVARLAELAVTEARARADKAEARADKAEARADKAEVRAEHAEARATFAEEALRAALERAAAAEAELRVLRDNNSPSAG